MVKRKPIFLSVLAVGAMVSVLSVGSLLSKLPGPWSAPDRASQIEAGENESSSVLAYVDLPAKERAEILAETAKGSKSIDRHRARYLLATDLIAQDRGGQALPLLDGLEKSYPVLEAQILAKRAQAQAATGDATEAEKTWKALIKQHPDDPATAEALFQLGRKDSKYWDQALEKFPAHPRSLEIVQARLEKDSKQPQLLLLLARHGIHLDGIIPVLNRLKKDYADQLKPEDWEAIAFAFWENAYYGSAGDAYAKAPPSALNLYRAARGAQLGERYQDAEQGYRALIQAFPNEKETGMALLRLADLADKPEEAISLLDQAIERFPEQAAEALLAKSKILQKQNSPQLALQIRQSVLEKYGNSEAAAKIRWEQAELLQQQGDLNGAWAWAKQIVEQNPDDELAPMAAFWAGKWATQLNQQTQAQEFFQHTLSRYPDSYYAWRSAALLGWDVGDFSTLRQKIPQVTKVGQRVTLPAGSEALQELYRLGQDRDAWTLWQVEFTNRLKPTVAEQFTDGLLRLSMDDHLNGIFMLSSLAWRETPEEQAEYKALKQQIGYWQALYPFPYMETIEQWAQQRQLNPMLVIALIRQESRFEPEIESSAGALGLMQVMPETGDWVAKQIGLQNYSLTNPVDNINLGTWYLDYTHREYTNNSMLAVASYNAGPGSVADWIKKYGLEDPDRFVEEIPFPETRGYVESVLGNYWNYLRLYNPEVSQKLAAVSSEHAAVIKNSQP
ncbi:transglycosylase SLT domain-containing protein [Leptolyngbya sp. NK1-12]|uniref:Transglycosylase SLT domain-containing protein n=1 Tax=Leptolyngbya sp. NK1-12 TaxID=2547451 RepID=A0AA96WXI7_9CYAN|nr:transglycosylase SLT domain-containing protein [Leptolyngbya sp. NK1-12]